jgi:hypothetical protein
MVRDRNTFAKRQRETSRKQKAEEKRARRRAKKSQADNGDNTADQSYPPKGHIGEPLAP